MSLAMYTGACNEFDEMSVLGAVTQIDPALLSNNGISASSAFIDAVGSAFRYRVDGGEPTTSVGHREDPSVASDETARIVLVGTSNVRNFRAVSEDGVVGTDFTITLAYGG